MHLSKTMLSAALAVISLAVAAPATASKYNSEAKPLTAWEDGVAQGQMYGRFYKEDLTYLRNNTWMRDPRPSGNAIYEQTEYQWFHDHIFIPDAWTNGTTDRYDLEVDDDDWYSQYDHDAYDDGASLGRIKTKVCEKQSWSPDPCSATPVETFDF